MKKTIAILATVAVSASFAGAQELSVSTTAAWESDYIFRGVRLADEYFAPSVDVSYGDFYAGVWAALPVENIDPTEVDYYAGFGFGINEMVSADVGVTYYTYPGDDDPSIDDTLEAYLGLSFEAVLSPSVYVFYDFDLEALTLEASVGHTVEVSETTAVDLSAYAGYVDPDADADYLYYGAGVAYTIAFTDNASWSIGVNYYGCEEAIEADGSKDKFTLSTSFSAGF